jgi:hypothetical protein
MTHVSLEIPPPRLTLPPHTCGHVLTCIYTRIILSAELGRTQPSSAESRHVPRDFLGIVRWAFPATMTHLWCLSGHHFSSQSVFCCPGDKGVAIVEALGGRGVVCWLRAGGLGSIASQGIDDARHCLPEHMPLSLGLLMLVG